MTGARSSAQFTVSGFGFDRVTWKDARREYWADGARGPLSKIVRRELFAVCEDAVSAWAWGRVHRVTHRMMLGEIGISGWRDEVMKLLHVAYLCRMGISRGLLDPSYADWTKHFDEADKSELQFQSWAHGKYLDDLIARINQGVFGPAFGMGDFLSEVKALLLADIEKKSHYHAAARLQLHKFRGEG